MDIAIPSSGACEARTEVADDNASASPWKDWDISTALPPHTDWPINAKELELLMSNEDLNILAKKVFDDEEYWGTASWKTHKYGMGRATHPGVSQNWQERYYIHQPSKKTAIRCRRNKTGGTATCKASIGSICPPFMRVLVAEFILGWNVDYSWETANYGKDLQIHENVYAIVRAKGGSIETTPLSNKRRQLENGSLTGRVGTNAQQLDSEGNELSNSHSMHSNTPRIANRRLKRRGETNKQMLPPVDMKESKERWEMFGKDIADYAHDQLHHKYNLMVSETAQVNKYKHEAQELRKKLDALQEDLARQNQQLSQIKEKEQLQQGTLEDPLHKHNIEMSLLKAELYDQGQRLGSVLRELDDEKQKTKVLSQEVVNLKKSWEVVQTDINEGDSSSKE